LAVPSQARKILIVGRTRAAPGVLPDRTVDCFQRCGGKLVAVAFEADYVGVVDDAVDHRGGDGEGAEQLDRLLHRSVVVTLDGASYRLRSHAAASDELRRVTTGTNFR
jgi:hypothetical protein